jgi:hypothetical protein
MKSEKWNRNNLALPGIASEQFPKERLFYWLIQPRNPVLVSENPVVKMFIEAMITGEKTDFIYVGGSTPGLKRTSVWKRVGGRAAGLCCSGRRLVLHSK